MRQNTQPEKQSLTPMQKQAVLVCIVCALAALLTIGITLVLIHRGKEPAASSEQPGTEQPADDANIADHYQINEQSSALLPETADAGDAYQNETLFIGDSNTVRLYANGLISLQQFCAKEGIGTSAALNEGIVTFKKDSSRYTIAEAVAKMKPRRVVIMLGTNDTGMAVEDFISNYKQLVQAIQTSYPYTDIIVNTVPPVPADHSNYPNMDQTRIDDFNMALLSMCEEMGLKFLNTAEALKDSTGYGNADYYQSGDIHLKTSGLKVLLNYLRTHAYETEDRRPDTNNIPSRAEYVPDPSSAVASSSSEVTSSSSEVQEDTTQYQASYRVDKTGGGTLSAGNDNGKTTLTYSVGASQSVSVTAVPASGHVFVKWSDGVTNKTRTDANFKQNLDVTAVFAAASVQISSSGKAAVGGSCTFHAKISGKYLEADSIRWYANGVEAASAAGQTSVTVPITAEMQGTTFKVYAVVSYNGSTVTSNTLEITVPGAPELLRALLAVLPAALALLRPAVLLRLVLPALLPGLPPEVHPVLLPLLRRKRNPSAAPTGPRAPAPPTAAARLTAVPRRKPGAAAPRTAAVRPPVPPTAVPRAALTAVLPLRARLPRQKPKMTRPKNRQPAPERRTLCPCAA